MRRGLDDVLLLGGVEWRISAIAETFYIATRCALLDGEPGSVSDIIKVMR